MRAELRHLNGCFVRLNRKGRDMTYQTADELVRNFSDTNNSWESQLDYELVQEILGHSLSVAEWQELTEKLDDVVFETVMEFQR
jgi:hypothetical protein